MFVYKRFQGESNNNRFKMMKLSKLAAIACFSVVTLGTTLSSCKKDKPTTVSITVTDVDGNRVQSAQVKLFGESSTGSTQDIRVNYVQYTNSSGQTEFDLSELTKPGQAGFVNLNVEVTKVGECGQGLVRVEEHMDNEKTVIISVDGCADEG